MWSCGVVVITSALHAEGPQFDPGRDHRLLFNKFASFEMIRTICLLSKKSLTHAYIFGKMILILNCKCLCQISCCKSDTPLHMGQSNRITAVGAVTQYMIAITIVTL